MKAKIENLEKDELIEMIKSLWIESRLRNLDLEFRSHDFKKEMAMEELLIETALHLDKKILTYFGYDV
jgi:hypothetical protein